MFPMQEKKKLFAGLGTVRIVKNCDVSHSFSLYGPPSPQITYVSYFQELYHIKTTTTTINIRFRYIKIQLSSEALMTRTQTKEIE